MDKDGLDELLDMIIEISDYCCDMRRNVEDLERTIYILKRTVEKELENENDD